MKNERYCLRKLLNSSNHTLQQQPQNQQQHEWESCRIVLMSDRDVTLRRVAAFLNRTYPNCSVLIPRHDANDPFKIEHGPFSGIGYYQDIATVNQTLSVPSTTTAFIGHFLRSSSQLIKELMVYQLHQNIRLPYYTGELLTCYYEDIER